MEVVACRSVVPDMCRGGDGDRLGRLGRASSAPVEGATAPMGADILQSGTDRASGASAGAGAGGGP